jgi:hypothetical protein
LESMKPCPSRRQIGRCARFRPVLAVNSRTACLHILLPKNRTPVPLLSAIVYQHQILQSDRYKSLAEAGFPVVDSRDPSANVEHHLIERGGGHYVDVGGTKIIAEGKVAVRGLVEPVGYTESGLRLSDDSVLDVDAVLWCTGFADKNIRATAKNILGAEPSHIPEDGSLGPSEIASRLDATWGLIARAKFAVCGNGICEWRTTSWVIGGTMMHQRWWSGPWRNRLVRSVPVRTA